MGSDITFVPVQVKSGVRRGSEEGTEVMVKHKWVEEISQKGIIDYIGEILVGFGLLMIFVGLFILGPAGFFGFKMEEGGPKVLMWLGFFFLLTLLGAMLQHEKIVAIEREKTSSIFFSKVSISDINDLKGIGVGWDAADAPYQEGLSRERAHRAWKAVSKWNDILKLVDENTGEVWVRGEGDSGELYTGRFYSRELYNKVRHAWEESYQQLRLREFEEKRKELEYLEKVGRYEEAAQIYKGLDMLEKAAEFYEKCGKYEEAAQIYEELNMLEKAGEMRRKKREPKIKHVNLDALIRQLGERGFTVTYNCSRCGAPVNISGETKAEAIQLCSHCGAQIEIIDVARLIERYLH